MNVNTFCNAFIIYIFPKQYKISGYYLKKVQSVESYKSDFKINYKYKVKEEYDKDNFEEDCIKIINKSYIYLTVKFLKKN